MTDIDYLAELEPIITWRCRLCWTTISNPFEHRAWHEERAAARKISVAELIDPFAGADDAQ